jgi:Flp pilus assembly protein CpaB
MNDVVGVADSVLPSMRVDVLVTGRPPNFNGTITPTVLQNIVVLSAGRVLRARGSSVCLRDLTLREVDPALVSSNGQSAFPTAARLAIPHPKR